MTERERLAKVINWPYSPQNREHYWTARNEEQRQHAFAQVDAIYAEQQAIIDAYKAHHAAYHEGCNISGPPSPPALCGTEGEGR